MKTRMHGSVVAVILVLVAVSAPAEAVDLDDFEMRPGPVLVLMEILLRKYHQHFGQQRTLHGTQNVLKRFLRIQNA